MLIAGRRTWSYRDRLSGWRINTTRTTELAPHGGRAGGAAKHRPPAGPHPGGGGGAFPPGRGGGADAPHRDVRGLPPLGYQLHGRGEAVGPAALEAEMRAANAVIAATDPRGGVEEGVIRSTARSIACFLQRRGQLEHSSAATAARRAALVGAGGGAGGSPFLAQRPAERAAGDAGRPSGHASGG